jgi:hypothetical protein
MSNYTMLLFFVAKGKVLPDLTFELFERDRNGVVVAKKYMGPWIIVDNGYLKWSTTVPPFKLTMNEAERRWSHWCVNHFEKMWSALSGF